MKEAKTGMSTNLAKSLNFFPNLVSYVAALAVKEPEKTNSNPAKAIAPERTARMTSLSGKTGGIYHDFCKLGQCRDSKITCFLNPIQADCAP
jgi:hypothetical protein